MKMQRAMTAALLAGALVTAGHAWAKSGEITVTGVISHVDQATRIATVTPTDGPPVVVQFSWNVGGPCDACIGGGRTGPLFEKTITEGSTWTITYTQSDPPGTAEWFPGGTVNTVYRAVKPGDNSPAPPRGGQQEAPAQ